jgi:hypothetical protein
VRVGIARSAALLEAAGFAVIEPMHPIRDVWHLVGHTAQYPGLLLVGVFARPISEAHGWGSPAAIIPAHAG